MIGGNVDRREWAAALAPAVLLAVVGGGGAAAFAATLDARERAALIALVEPRVALLFFGWFVLSIALGAAARAAYRRWVGGAARLAEDAQVLLGAGPARALPAPPTDELGAIASVVDKLAAQRDSLRADIARQVADAAHDVEQERNRLAALMAELTQSVVVCNLDGRILLYNTRARLQLRALSDAPALAGGAELIGIGRSIYAILDRALIVHALEAVQQRLARGAAHPSAQFVTATRAGQLLRVQLAPVRDEQASLGGFVLVLDNVTRDLADAQARDALLQSLTEGSRASLGNLQAAVELLDEPGLDAATRERFFGVIHDEVKAMGARLADVAAHAAPAVRWPLEDMQGADLLAAAARRIEVATGRRAGAAEVDADLWLKVESFSVLRALEHLAARAFGSAPGIERVELGVARVGGFAQLDLAWDAGMPSGDDELAGWEREPMRTADAAAGTASPSVADVMQRHGGECWLERDRGGDGSHGHARFRLLLPLADAAEPLDAAAVVRVASRPEVYDFDLFRTTDASRALADRRLDELTYTVFDTETTGLDPSGGDRILQLGAARIVAGKLRREDSFEQLVDPERGIPEAGIAIHGITPDRVRGAPTISAVLPAFHAYASETVLVAHNAAFDMRFLELQGGPIGVAFEQPVLDTLLLAAVVHPAQASHGLEAIAGRLGVPLLGRHTALGDALVTAEVFLALVPLLDERGIVTLGQALEAARGTWLARVAY